MERLSARDTLEHAWRYFALHAGQRMSLFNYFVLCFAFVSAGLAGCIRAEFSKPCCCYAKDNARFTSPTIWASRTKATSTATSSASSV